MPAAGRHTDGSGERLTGRYSGRWSGERLTSWQAAVGPTPTEREREREGERERIWHLVTLQPARIRNKTSVATAAPRNNSREGQGTG